MMGAPMIGLMLFSLRQVLMIFIASLGVVLILSIFSALQIIPYAPILNSQHSASAHLSLYWTLCLTLAAGFYVIYQTIIMNAMVNAWRSREESIRSLSETDALTGVANRRHILSILEQLLTRKGNSEQTLSVLMVDIDHFKRINDEYGHLIGDRALHATAHALRDCLRNDEIIGRYGGEEFLVLLPNTSSIAAQNIAERCLQAINTLVIDANGAALPLSTSIGLCTRVYSDIRNSDHIIHLADEAMYAAKRAGRNQIVAA
jgi:diguanylate cyclase (GGDEF)-like protein